MSPIPLKVRKQIDQDPWYKVCCRANGDCWGRITIEHALLYQGKQVQALWALLPLCWAHHLGTKLDKHWDRWKALKRFYGLPPDEFIREAPKYAKAYDEWKKTFIYLSKKYDPIHGSSITKS